MHVSPDGNTLVVSNLDSGFDVYHLDNSTSDGSILHPCHGRKVPITFIHGGFALLGGSSFGQVSIWDARSRKLLQVLKHEGTLSSKFDKSLTFLTTFKATDSVLSVTVRLFVTLSGCYTKGLVSGLCRIRKRLFSYCNWDSRKRK